jgi:hypothetical protein
MKVKTSNIKDAIVEYTNTETAKAKKKVTVEVDEGVVKLTDVVTIEKTDKGLAFSIDEILLCNYSAKAGRCYWKKLPATIDVSNDVEVAEPSEEEDEERETPVICKDRSRYEPYARGDRVSQDCADFVAKTLRSCEDVDDLMARGTDFLTEIDAELPKKSDAKNWIEHVAKWDKLNPGHRRMLMGQALRTAEKRADEADTLKQFKKVLKAAFAVKK